MNAGGKPTPPPTPALELLGVTKRYGKRVALDGLSLTVARGTLLGLVGRNGAGKTTTLLLTAGLLRPDAGAIRLLGEGPFDPVAMAGRVSLMPQDSALPVDATATELLSFYARLQGLPPASVAGAVADMLERVHLADRARAKIRTLSHGMRRRVMIAQAFLGNPELVLLDEPLSGLDPHEIVNFRNLLNACRGVCTILLSSHQLDEVEKLCDRIAFIDRGRAVQHDTLEAVTGSAAELRYLLGTSPDLPALTAKFPQLAFALAEGPTLVCRFARTQAPADVNAAVLRTLLDASIGVLEVRRGAGLESAYLNRPPDVQPGPTRA